MDRNTCSVSYVVSFFFTPTAPTEVSTYSHTLSLHDAPPIYGLLGGMAQQALGAPQPAGAPPSHSPPSHSGPPAGALAAAPAAAAASGGSALSEAYSFSCPSGASYSIPVSYRNASCGAAMKNFARVYSCNLIGDLDRKSVV